MSDDRRATTTDPSLPVLTSETRQSNWRRANLLRYSVHLAVTRALDSGDLEKQPCEVCGATTADAHHDRYDQPLNVGWLCRKREGEGDQPGVVRREPTASGLFPTLRKIASSGVPSAWVPASSI